MSTEAKKTKREPKADSVFITKKEIGRELCVMDLTTIDKWVKAGTFPPPHSRPGERTMLWRRKHWNTFIETRQWPNEAWAKRPSNN